jgi:DNA-binding LytR/AlgR family response regulator
MLARHGLVRCHRSYFINAAHVDLVRKDANGFALAQLDWEDIKPIPVSKRYYEAVTAVL